MLLLSGFPLGKRHLAALEEIKGVEVQTLQGFIGAEELLANADVFITYGGDLNSNVLEGMKNLKWVQSFSAGIDLLPVRDLLERQIIVTNAQGIHQIPMAEYVIGAVIDWNRRVHLLRQQQQAHTWDQGPRFREAFGQTLGIVGIGSIGQGVASLAKALGMRVLGLNTSGRDVPGVDEVFPQKRLHEMLPLCDFVVLAVPGTSETRHLMGEKEFLAMKESAVIINIARGSVVDPEALIEALRLGRPAGAVLDVFEEEPLPPESPLWDMEQVIVTPHISGRSPRYVERAMEILVQNLRFYLDGNYQSMINRVDLSRGY